MKFPEYGDPGRRPDVSADMLRARTAACRSLMERRGLECLVVYGDREHFANLRYLSGFDPRFEEALLILRHDRTPLVVTGNEGTGHLPVSPLYLSGELRHMRYQTFSLMDQPRNENIPLEEIFASEGIRKGTRTGVVGWKYYASDGFSSPGTVSDVPSYIWNILQKCAGEGFVTNATDLMISPDYGLRSTLSVDEIAIYEYSNIMGSRAVRSILMNFAEGVSDFGIIQKAGLTGWPFASHPSLKSSGNLNYGLSSPTGDVIRRGDPCSVSIAYWGSNICRAGWVAEDENDLPPEARDYIREFAGPYFMALKEWFLNLRPGTEGGSLYQIIQSALPFGKFHVYLNPGHLIHDDEWLSSPVYKGSGIRLRSGMYMQSDIIPRSPVFSSARMEEGYVIADGDLRKSLMSEWPEVYSRCMMRRSFMEDLGFDLPEEVLPLSDLAGIMVPFFLDCSKVICLV